MTTIEEPAAEAKALSKAEAAARIGGAERTEDAAAVRTRGGEASQPEATTIRSGKLAACPEVYRNSNSNEHLFAFLSSHDK